MSQKQLGFFLLRLSLASVFAYAAIASFLHPDNWIGYFPLFLRHLIPQTFLLNSFSLYEIILTVWLLSGKKIFFAAILSALTVVGIIVFNLSQLDILFRDFAIIFAALALAVFTYK